MNERAQGLHAAAEDERNRHVRATKAAASARFTRDRERRRISALVAPPCDHLAADGAFGSDPGLDGTGFSDGVV